MSSDLVKFAYHYTKRLNFALAPAPLGKKNPVKKGWQERENVITDAEQARRVFATPQNICLVHEFSNTCTLDIDHLEWTRQALSSIGIDLDEILTTAPVRIKGKNGEKPLFKLPDNHGFKRRSLAWPHPTEKQKNGKARMVTVFELRGGQGQDVLPPSIHPDTGKAYEWVGNPPRSIDDIPMLPKILLDLWTYFNETQDALLDACSWRVPPPVSEYIPQSTGLSRVGERPGDIFNAQVSLQSVLEDNQYKAQQGGYLSPSSATGSAGVRLMMRDGVLKAFSHHGSCPLNDGYWHDAFSAFVILEHDGDLQKGVRAAVQRLNLPPRHPVPAEPTDTLNEVRARWESAGEDLLRQGGMVLDSIPGNHHMRNALIELWAILTHIAPTSIQQHGGQWVINYGGLTRLKAYGVTGRNSDITARLKQLAELGYLLKVIKDNPDDQYSSLLLVIPADPADLAVMKLTKEDASKKRLTLATKRMRRSALADSKVCLTLPYYKEANPKGIGERKAHFRFSGAGLNLLLLSSGAASTVSELAYLRDKKPHSIRRQVRQLQNAEIVTRKGHILTVNMTWREFLEAMWLNRESDATIRGKVLRALEHSERNARRRVFGALATTPRRELAKRKKVWDLLRERVDRVRAGESLQSVLRLAA